MSLEEKKAIEMLNGINTSFKEYRGKLDKEIEKFGEGSAETRKAVDDLTAKLIETDKALTEIRKMAAAPRSGKGETQLTPEQELRHKSYEEFCRRGFTESMAPEVRASLSQAADAEGGFFAPPEFETNIIMNAYDDAAIRPLCDVRPTGRGQVIGPIMSKPTVAWGQELLEISPQDLAAGANTLNIKKVQALITISNDTLDDSESDVIGELNMAFSDGISESEDIQFVTGATPNTPEGVMVNALVQANYKASGVADNIFDADNNGMDVLLQALFALKSTYRKNATWAMNSTTMGSLMQLKDGQGKYYWQPTTALGVASTLHGKPYIAAEGMPDIAAGTYPIVIGDWRRGYKIRDRSGLSIQRLSEKYATYSQTGFIVSRRTGGQVKLAEAFVPIKIAAS